MDIQTLCGRLHQKPHAGRAKVEGHKALQPLQGLPATLHVHPSQRVNIPEAHLLPRLGASAQAQPALLQRAPGRARSASRMTAAPGLHAAESAPRHRMPSLGKE